MILTSLADLWTQVHPASLTGVQDFLHSRFFEDLLNAALTTVLGYPAFAVAGVPCVVLALLGRKKGRERFLHQDQI